MQIGSRPHFLQWKTIGKGWTLRHVWATAKEHAICEQWSGALADTDHALAVEARRLPGNLSRLSLGSQYRIEPLDHFQRSAPRRCTFQSLDEELADHYLSWRMPVPSSYSLQGHQSLE